MLALLRRSFTGLPLSLLALFFLVLSSSLGLLYSWVSLDDLQAVRQNIYARNEMPEFVLQATTARLNLLRVGLLGVALSAAATVGYMLRTGRFHQEIRELWQQFQEASSSVARAVQQVSGIEKLLAALLVLGILGVRLYYFRVYPLSTDEVATYDYFVRGGAVAITSFYPIPNNHILFSLSCWLVSWFTTDDVLVLRLPTLLISLVGTVATYAVLIRLTNFRTATLTVGLFCLSPQCLYYAMAGRGYFLLIVLALGQFFAALAILHAPRYERLGWGIFVITGVLGLLTIPTYAYPLVSLGLWMGVVFLRRRNLAGLLGLAAASILVGAGTVVAYGPVICVTGLRALAANQYIAPQTLREFWQSYGLYLYKPARELFGHEQLSVPGFVVLLAAGLLVLPALPGHWRRVALPAVFLVLLPFVFMPIQRVYSPARVLLYGTFFFFLGVASLGEWVLQRLRLSRLVALVGIGGVLSLYGVYQVAHFRYSVWGAQTQEQQLRQAYAWLRPRQPRRVYFDAPFHKLYFHHYALTTGYPLWLFEASSTQGSDYDYVVLFRGQTTLPAWLPAAYRPVYSDAGATIYQALAPSAVQPMPAPATAPRAGK